jgi:hypothetical protein
MSAPHGTPAQQWITEAQKLIKQLEKQQDNVKLKPEQEKKLGALNTAINSNHGRSKGFIRTDQAIQGLNEMIPLVRSGAKKVKGG